MLVNNFICNFSEALSEAEPGQGSQFMSTRASHLLAPIVKPLHLNGLDDKALVTSDCCPFFDPLRALQRTLHLSMQPIGFTGNHFPTVWSSRHPMSCIWIRRTPARCFAGPVYSLAFVQVTRWVSGADKRVHASRQPIPCYHERPLLCWHSSQHKYGGEVLIAANGANHTLCPPKVGFGQM